MFGHVFLGAAGIEMFHCGTSASLLRNIKIVQLFVRRQFQQAVQIQQGYVIAHHKMFNYLEFLETPKSDASASSSSALS